MKTLLEEDYTLPSWSRRESASRDGERAGEERILKKPERPRGKTLLTEGESVEVAMGLIPAMAKKLIPAVAKKLIPVAGKQVFKDMLLPEDLNAYEVRMDISRAKRAIDERIENGTASEEDLLHWHELRLREKIWRRDFKEAYENQKEMWDSEFPSFTDEELARPAPYKLKF